MKANIVFTGLNLVLTVVIGNIVALPWWSFLVMSLFMGLFAAMRGIKINAFLTGFASGFLNWFGATLFFHSMYEGDLIGRVAEMFYMPAYLFLPVLGIIGGLLNGLACYTGYSIFKEEDVLQLD